MTLIVETGEGLATSDAYDSLVNVNKYFTDRPTHPLYLIWEKAGNSDRESAIRLATEYLDYKFSWKGVKATSTQMLEWPRELVYDSRGQELIGVIPTNIKKALAELAVRSLSSSLLEDKSRTSFTKREKIDVIEVEYLASAPSQPVFSVVNSLLKDYIISLISKDLVRA